MHLSHVPESTLSLVALSLSHVPTRQGRAYVELLRLLTWSHWAMKKATNRVPPKTQISMHDSVSKLKLKAGGDCTRWNRVVRETNLKQ